MPNNDYSFLPFGAGGIPANENSGTSLAAPRWYSGTGAPTAGTYNVGDVIYNCNPSSGTAIGWACTVAGTPGTFQAFGIGAPAPSTITATTGTLATGIAQFLMNPAAASTYSLPDVVATRSGAIVAIKNISANQVTLTPLSTNGYADATAITLSANQGVELVGNSPATFWYNRLIALLPVITSTPVDTNTLTNGVRLNLLNPAATGSFKLPDASANYAGFVMTLNNISANTVTLAPIATNQYQGGLSITLAQNAAISIVTPGSSTNWYKAA